jgi:hypothetical protein
MQEALRQKINQVCSDKIANTRAHVGLSFYAFFANKKDQPQLLMQAAQWWTQTQQLEHFEKAVKIKGMLEGIGKPHTGLSRA